MDDSIDLEIIRSNKTLDKSKKTVSIIVPCYNCSKWIEQTLISIEKQSYKNIEVICINDGSSDNTFSILKKWVNSNRLVFTLINKKNEGVSIARNTGIHESKSDYVFFLDSDDCINSNAIGVLLNSICQTNADVSFFKYSRNYGAVMLNNTKPKVAKLRQEEMMHVLLYKMADYGFCCYLYKRTLLIKYNLIFHTDTKYGEDREFIWKYLCHCKWAGCIDGAYYWYRINNQSATIGNISWKLTDALVAMNRTSDYLTNHKCAFCTEFNNFMYARVMWSIAKNYALSRNKKLFNKLCNEYQIRQCMIATTKDRLFLVKFASLMFLIHPYVFYYFVGLKGLL